MVVNSEVRTKSISVNNLSNDEIKILLSPFVGEREDYSNFKIYRGIAYTDELDRDGEIATHDYLEQLAPKLVGVPILKDHAWNGVDGIVGRVVKSTLEMDGDTEIVRILFYAVKGEDIEAIENGLYYGLSVGSCVTADGKYLTGCTDAYEVSLVVVPAVPGAHITKSKKNGGNSDMDELNKKIDELESRIANYEEEYTCLEAENEALKAENEELKSKIAEAEQREFEAEAEEVLENKATEAADEMAPANDTVKGFIVSELKAAGYSKVDSAEDAVSLKCGKFISFKDFDSVVESVKTKYSQLGLLGKTEVKPVEPKVEPKVETKGLDFTPGEVAKKSATVKRGMSIKFN